MTFKGRAIVAYLIACIFAVGFHAHANPRRPRSSIVTSDPFALRGKVLIERASESWTQTIYSVGTEFAATVQAECRSRGEITKDLPFALGIRSFRWRLEQPVDDAELRKIANADSCLIGLTESQRYSTEALPTDPEVIKQKHLMAIEAGAAYEMIPLVPNLRPVTIAVIDTGIDLQHPDLKDVLWSNSGEIPGNGIDDDHNGYVDDVNGYNFADQLPSPAPTGNWNHQHGTHVAGLAAAQAENGIGVAGIMGRGARIMMLNVFGESSGAYVSDIANAIRYAADNGADVINMSLGGSNRNATYESALDYAIQKGVTIIVAAGNESTQIGGKTFQSPASYSPFFEGLIAVAATDTDGGGLSTFSNYSADEVELSAPGAEISNVNRGLLSTWPGGKYARLQGTSMASPLVAGAAGLAIAYYRAYGMTPTPVRIERALVESANRNPALVAQVRSGNTLNLRKLVEFVRNDIHAATATRSHSDY